MLNAKAVALFFYFDIFIFGGAWARAVE